MSLISLPRLEFLALIPDTDTGLGDTGRVTITITISPLPQGYYTLEEGTLLLSTVHCPLDMATPTLHCHLPHVSVTSYQL